MIRGYSDPEVELGSPNAKSLPSRSLMLLTPESVWVTMTLKYFSVPVSWSISVEAGISLTY